MTSLQTEKKAIQDQIKKTNSLRSYGERCLPLTQDINLKTLKPL